MHGNEAAGHIFSICEINVYQRNLYVIDKQYQGFYGIKQWKISLLNRRMLHLNTLIFAKHCLMQTKQGVRNFQISCNRRKFFEAQS